MNEMDIEASQQSQSQLQVWQEALELLKILLSNPKAGRDLG